MEENAQRNQEQREACSVSAEQVRLWMESLRVKENLEAALIGLTRYRNVIPDLGLILWNSPGAVTVLLMEITSSYPYINPPILTTAQSNRICNSLSLMQCIASNPRTQPGFLRAKLPYYFYPFLMSSSRSPPIEYLRLTSLGVIGALVKGGNPEVMYFLLHTEIISLCLNAMEVGRELSKTVATFILQKIMLVDAGLSSVCDNYERFYQVIGVLGRMVSTMCYEPSARLLKQVIRCYCRLTENHFAREALRSYLPPQLRDPVFTSQCVQEDRQTLLWLQRLLEKC